MKLKLIRKPSTSQCTIGQLYVDDVFECFTLEDVVRPIKIAGETAIAAGTYNVVVTYSPHFKRDLPLLLNVPNYDGVRIHPGNTKANTEGCILVGKAIGNDGDSITQSVIAFNKLFDKLKAQDSQITLEIVQSA